MAEIQSDLITDVVNFLKLTDPKQAQTPIQPPELSGWELKAYRAQKTGIALSGERLSCVLKIRGRELRECIEDSDQTADGAKLILVQRRVAQAEIAAKRLAEGKPQFELPYIHAAVSNIDRSFDFLQSVFWMVRKSPIINDETSLVTFGRVITGYTTGLEQGLPKVETFTNIKETFKNCISPQFAPRKLTNVQ